MNRLDRGEVTAAEVARTLGLSVRQVRRLLAGYRRQGVAALVHGNRQRQPVHALDPVVRQRVVELARTTYPDVNDTHLTEMLAEREGIVLGRSTVRRIRRQAGLASPRQRRSRQHRQRRERRPREGMLLQIDASAHAWLEERGPHLTLVAAIDDATGQVPAALFRPTEDAQGYFLLLEQTVQTVGRPEAVYHDGHSIFLPPTAHAQDRDAQLAGTPALTQFGRLLAELGIAAIPARSPQAKGRIERLFGTFQDRLVTELRLAQATTLEAAQAVLTAFLPRFNARFAVPPRELASAYRPPDPAVDPHRLFCFEYTRTVANDDTVRLGEHRLQLLPTRSRMSYARAKVEVHERLDGSLAVYYHDQLVASQAAPPEAPVLRARAGRALPASVPRPTLPPSPVEPAEPERFDLPPPAPIPPRRSGPHRPAANHPWRAAVHSRRDTIRDQLE